MKKDICGKEWLEEDRCKALWHRHCDFCLEKINTDMQGECYCTNDTKLWVCADCYNAYKEHFGLTFEKDEDIEAASVENIVGIIIAPNHDEKNN